MSTVLDSPVWLVLAAWPTTMITLVTVTLLLTPSDQRTAVLRALAEVIRTARGIRRR